MPKECGLKAQIREAVVEVMAEEMAKQAECEYFQRKQWSLMDARKKCGIEPPYSTTTECQYGKEPLRYVEYDLSDVPVAQMVEELRKRTGLLVDRVRPNSTLDVRINSESGPNIEYGTVGPAEVIVIRHEKGDDE